MTARQARELIAGPSPQLTRSVLQLKRHQLRLVVGLLTGHCRLARHLCTIKVADSPVCSFCEREDESALHYLGRCYYFAACRYRTLGDHFLDASALQAIPFTKLLSFVRESRRFDEDEVDHPSNT